MAEDTSQPDLFGPILLLVIIVALVFGSPYGFSGFVIALLIAGAVLSLIWFALWVWSIWNQVERDKIKVQALEKSLKESTIEGYGKRKWQQLIEQEDEIIQRLDEKLNEWSRLGLFLYKKFGGDSTLRLHTAGAEELDWAKYYVAHEGEYYDRVREEEQEAKLLEYRQKLARGLDLSAEQEEKLDEIIADWRSESEAAQEPSTKEADDGS